MVQNTLDRRRFLRFAAAGVALSGVALLEACAQPSSPAAPPTSAAVAPSTPTSAAAKPTAPGAAPTTASAAAPTLAPAAAAPTTAPVNAAAATSVATRGVTLPTRIPVEGIKPDLPASADGLIDAAFVNYPANADQDRARTRRVAAARSTSPPGRPAPRRLRWIPTRCGRPSTRSSAST